MIIVSNLVFLISTNFGERLMFAPSVIVCYAAARLLFKAARLGQDQPLSAALRAPVVVAPLLVVLPAAVIVVLNRMPDWRDEMTLFTADVAKYPDSVRLNSYLSHMHYIAGDKLLGQQADASAAAADFQQAKAYALQSLKVRNAFSEYNAVLGLAEYQLHQCREAIPNLQQAATFDIYRATALPMTAACYEELQMPAEALAMFKQIDAAGIPYAHGWFQLGNDAAAHGDDDASIAYFRKVLGATPDNASAYANIAAAQHRKGDYPASLDSAKQCIALQPTLAQCLIVAADDLMRTGHADEARAYLARAQAIK